MFYLIAETDPYLQYGAMGLLAIVLSAVGYKAGQLLDKGISILSEGVKSIQELNATLQRQEMTSASSRADTNLKLDDIRTRVTKIEERTERGWEAPAHRTRGASG